MVVTLNAEFLVNSRTYGSQLNPDITALANGGFVVTWEDMGNTFPDPTNDTIKARIFDAAGLVLTEEVVVNTQADLYQEAPSVTALANGGFVVTWEDASRSLGVHGAFPSRRGCLTGSAIPFSPRAAMGQIR